ncbi:hypothetical protein NL676_010733 [Syzygium grande]|nr:hypothetical protein NL676_010733 [Syzygium grande]
METRQKIEETVMAVLRSADMEAMTEFKLRNEASEKLGFDLSDIDSKKLVRSVLESFLLSDAAGEDGGQGAEPDVRGEAGEVAAAAPAREVKMELGESGGRVICELSDRRYVTLQDYNGTNMVSIRDYYIKDGKKFPGAKGISLTKDQWSALSSSLPSIEEAIKKMESKLRPQTIDVALDDVSNSMATLVQGLVPIEINRFDGKNYHHWAEQMEFFLKQMKIAYVLTDPRPVANLIPEASSVEIARVKAAEEKWMNDDYICRRNILSSLSDELFYKYSQTTYSAKDLWEKLRLVYLYEECGTKRLQVKRYIEFEMVDGKSVIEQVQELNRMADSIAAAGISVDENFHVSVIISKLPPSWKDFCLKLMHHEHLSFQVLMNHLRVEEELHNQYKSKEPHDIHGIQPSGKVRSSNNSIRNSGKSPKMRESETVGKPVVCYSCGKKGHYSRHCRSRQSDKEANIVKESENLA